MNMTWGWPSMMSTQLARSFHRWYTELPLKWSASQPSSVCLLARTESTKYNDGEVSVTAVVAQRIMVIFRRSKKQGYTTFSGRKHKHEEDLESATSQEAQRNQNQIKTYGRDEGIESQICSTPFPKMQRLRFYTTVFSVMNFQKQN